MRRRFVATTLWVVIVGTSTIAPAETGIQKAQRDLEETAINIVNGPLERFQNEDRGNCTSDNLKSAAGKAFGIYNVYAQRRGLDFEAAIVPASSFLYVGDTAAKYGCKVIAREMYMAVIDSYYGAAYSGVRERAKVRLDVLK